MSLVASAASSDGLKPKQPACRKMANGTPDARGVRSSRARGHRHARYWVCVDGSVLYAAR